MRWKRWLLRFASLLVISAAVCGLTAVFFQDGRLGHDLYSAIDGDDESRVRSLLKVGADPNYRYVETDHGEFWRKVFPRRRPVIHLAAYHGKIRIVRLLLDAGADPTVRDGHGKSAMDYANDQPDLVTKLAIAIADQRWRR